MKHLILLALSLLSVGSFATSAKASSTVDEFAACTFIYLDEKGRTVGSAPFEVYSENQDAKIYRARIDGFTAQIAHNNGQIAKIQAKDDLSRASSNALSGYFLVQASGAAFDAQFLLSSGSVFGDALPYDSGHIHNERDVFQNRIDESSGSLSLFGPDQPGTFGRVLISCLPQV